MERDENGVVRWVHRKNLYGKWFWSSAKTCLKAFAITAAIMFVLLTAIVGFADEFSLGQISLMGKISGVVFLILAVLTIPSLFIWAWAQGGVEEWEYEAEAWHVRGRRIPHKTCMKVLRALAWIAMFLPAKPNQKMALRRLLYDNEAKTLDIWLFNDAKVSGNEKTGVIKLESHGSKAEIGVPRENYAEMLAFFTPAPKPKRKRTRKTAKKEV